MNYNNIIFNSYFLFWKGANRVDEFYNQKIESYLYNNSHEKSITENDLTGRKLYYSGTTTVIKIYTYCQAKNINVCSDFKTQLQTK